MSMGNKKRRGKNPRRFCVSWCGSKVRYPLKGSPYVTGIEQILSREPVSLRPKLIIPYAVRRFIAE